MLRPQLGGWQLIMLPATWQLVPGRYRARVWPRAGGVAPGLDGLGEDALEARHQGRAKEQHRCVHPVHSGRLNDALGLRSCLRLCSDLGYRSCLGLRSGLGLSRRLRLLQLCVPSSAAFASAAAAVASA